MHHNGTSLGILETDFQLRHNFPLYFAFIFYDGGGIALALGMVGRSYLYTNSNRFGFGLVFFFFFMFYSIYLPISMNMSPPLCLMCKVLQSLFKKMPLFFFFLFYRYGCLHVYLCATCMPCTHRGQKKMFDLLELEL